MNEPSGWTLLVPSTQLITFADEECPQKSLRQLRDLTAPQHISRQVSASTSRAAATEFSPGNQRTRKGEETNRTARANGRGRLPLRETCSGQAARECPL